jgi:hypothetical protein
MSQAHTKVRALAGLALGASLAIAGCGDAGDGTDALADGTDAAAVERLEPASAAGPPSGALVGLVEKPSPVLPPTR